MIETRSLPGGTRLLLESVPQSDVVSIGFWFLQGSRDEGPGETGMSHFLEHMLFKGTERRSAFQIARDIDRVGGILNAYTEKEVTCYYCTVAREHLDLGLDVLADMVFHATLEPSDVEKERSVVVNEIRSYLDSPEDCAFERYCRGLWGDHPLGRRITGDIEDVGAITPSSLQRFYKSRYTTGALVVAAAGGVEAGPMADRISALLEGAPQGASAAPHRVVPSRRQERSFARARFAQDQIYIGTDFGAAAGNAELVYGTLVLSTAFGESMSSRLFQELRENRGLCYSIGTFRSLYSDVSVWSIYAATSTRQTGELLASVDAELQRLAGDPLSEGEVEDAKAHLKGGLVLSKSDVESRMKRLVQLDSLFGEPLEYEESLANIESVTVDTVARLCGDLVAGKPFNVLAYGGRKSRNWNGLRFAY